MRLDMPPEKYKIHLAHGATCRVCGESAHFLLRDSDYVCLRADCRLVLDKKQYLNKSSYNQFFFLQSAQIKSSIALGRLKKKRLAAKIEAENKENVSCWEKVIHPDYGYDPEFYPYAVVPSNSKQITKLPRERIRVFRDFLDHLVHETLSEGLDNKIKPLPRGEAPMETLLFEAKACSICGGCCCGIGEEHAFLKKETIGHYMSGHPEQTPEQVLASYMEYLPEKSFEDSCVNHTRTGCALPRDMRSHVCNDYLCDPLNKLRNLSLQPLLPKGVFFIRRAQNNWKKDDPDEDNPIVGTELVFRED